MEPVYCPNGHPNRPGTRICIVCRALLAPSTPVAPQQTSARATPPITTPPPPLPPPPVSPARPVVAAETAAEPPATAPPTAEAAPASKKSSRAWLWLILVVLFLLAGATGLATLLTPDAETAAVAPASVPDTVVVPAVEPATSFPATDTPRPTSTTELSPTAAVVAVVEPADVSPTPVATITPLPVIVGIVITPTIAFGREANFIQNGEFADDWVNGWTLETSGQKAVVEVRAVEPDSRAVHLEKSGPGMTRLAQRVVLTYPVEGITFRGDFHLTGTYDAANEGRSALILRYEDVNGEPLGASVWLDGSAESTWLWGAGPLPSPGPTVNIRYGDGDPQSVELRLGSELTDELPGVNLIDIRQITVLLVLLGSDSCRPDDCETTLQAGPLSLTAEGP